MKERFCCFVIALQIVSWVSAARRPFPPTGGHYNHGQTEIPQSSPYSMESKKGLKSIESKPETMQEEYGGGFSKIGSSPPSCEHKCYGCIPCEAVQVPAPADAAIWAFSILIMSLRNGNANVALHSTVREHC